MDIVIFERPENGEQVESLVVWDNGDITALLVPSLADGETSVLVGRDIDGDGVFQIAENYWLSENDRAELEFLSGLYKGCTWRRNDYE